ncbi:MAG TPA: AraC family transcriptional regulator ligand-binding domain-containing protein [Polyangiaceae bacterium]|nr:AraC family transcriptional regulator ligand-binding domain-containing protein [Polyangiaceae bacterium]
MKAATALVWLPLGYLHERGGNVEWVLRAAGLQAPGRDRVGTRVSLSQLHAVWRATAACLSQPTLGIELAHRLDPRSSCSWPPAFSRHEHMVYLSASLRAGALRHCKYVRLLRDGLQIDLEDAGTTLLERFTFCRSDEPRVLIDFHMAAELVLWRRVLGDEAFKPTNVWFACPAPKDLTPFHEHFGEALHFDASFDAISYDNERFDRPLPGADPIVLEVLEQQASKALARLPAPDDLVAEVCRCISAHLAAGDASAHTVAAVLGVSERTLYRHLRNFGTTYRELLAGLRCQLARRHLAARDRSIHELVRLLGFSSRSAFQRAFKAWTGETPCEFQNHRTTEG